MTFQIMRLILIGTHPSKPMESSCMPYSRIPLKAAASSSWQTLSKRGVLMYMGTFQIIQISPRHLTVQWVMHFKLMIVDHRAQAHTC